MGSVYSVDSAEFGDKIKNLEDGIAKNKKVIQSAQEAIKKAENDVEQARKGTSSLFHVLPHCLWPFSLISPTILPCSCVFLCMYV